LRSGLPAHRGEALVVGLHRAVPSPSRGTEDLRGLLWRASTIPVRWIWPARVGGGASRREAPAHRGHPHPRQPPPPPPARTPPSPGGAGLLRSLVALLAGAFELSDARPGYPLRCRLPPHAERDSRRRLGATDSLQPGRFPDLSLQCQEPRGKARLEGARS